MTPKMQKLLIYIEARLKSNGIAPSYEEMKNHLGLNSKSGIFRLVNSLEERGKIRRLPGRARAIVMGGEVIGKQPPTSEMVMAARVREVASKLASRQISGALAAGQLRIIVGDA